MSLPRGLSARRTPPTSPTEAALVEQQAALHRIATLVAHGAPPAQVYAAVAQEIAQSVGAAHAVLHRHDPDTGTTVLVAARDDPSLEPMPLGERYTLDGDNVNALVMRTGRPARIDDYEGALGSTADRIRALRIRSAVGVPIIDDGRLWGTAIVASPRAHSLAPGLEERMADFAMLVATTITSVEARAELTRSRERQASLRRVATLVARGATAAEVFNAVTVEVARSLNAHNALMVRYEPAGTFLVIATRDQEDLAPLPLGERFPLAGDNVASLVFRTGRPARMDTHVDAKGSAAERIRELGIRSGVGAPIIVGGQLWGAAIVGSSTLDVFPADSEERIAEFTDLAATAIANAETYAELTASRARIIAAGDEARRRLERDLHDGAQQRLVSLAIEMRALELSMSGDDAALRKRFCDIIDGLVGVSYDLQELSRGIHPAILSQGGLTTALANLARRSLLPVALEVNLDRDLDQTVEVAVYYFVAEALTNVAKHARADAVSVSVCTDSTQVVMCVDDDGVGGADPKEGSGLVGLTDRVEALHGSIHISSPAGDGTRLRATIPADYC